MPPSLSANQSQIGAARPVANKALYPSKQNATKYIRMSGYPPFDGLAATAAALIVILSAIVSLVGSGARWRSVMLGQARVQDLCELTGITDPQRLQDVFGPPDMNRVWRHVSAGEIKAARQPLGHLISNEMLDYACMGIAVLSFVWRHPVIEILLLAALLLQVASWILSARLPR